MAALGAAGFCVNVNLGGLVINELIRSIGIQFEHPQLGLQVFIQDVHATRDKRTNLHVIVIAIVIAITFIIIRLLLSNRVMSHQMISTSNRFLDARCGKEHCGLVLLVGIRWRTTVAKFSTHKVLQKNTCTVRLVKAVMSTAHVSALFTELFNEHLGTHPANSRCERKLHGVGLLKHLAVQAVCKHLNSWHEVSSSDLINRQNAVA
mmetsp:Transcript_15235/g.29556  ORF Transcript_15235/g.29556 Transcript_15235/m.29556 type:complete len:206 (+) Transcript_15235:143-760(+)